jgi:hypothetical protein
MIISVIDDKDNEKNGPLATSIFQQMIIPPSSRNGIPAPRTYGFGMFAPRADYGLWRNRIGLRRIEGLFVLRLFDDITSIPINRD